MKEEREAWRSGGGAYTPLDGLMDLLLGGGLLALQMIGLPVYGGYLLLRALLRIVWDAARGA